MGSNSFFIYANYYLNWATVICCGSNILCMAILALTAFLERKNLNEIVTDLNWKSPIIIASVLSLSSMGCLFMSSMGIAVFWVSLIALVLQVFIVLDDYNALAREIEQPEWYLTAHKLCMVVAVITAICLTLFLLTTIAVTDY